MTPRELIDDGALENSPTVANCRMNREREIRGTNSYAADLGFDVIELLEERLERSRSVAWLDLCCGTGRALIQAAEHFRSRGFENRVSITGLDLVDMFAAVPAEIDGLTFNVASVHRWSPAHAFDLITCVHGLHYVGDKLGVVSRAASWLVPDGLFAAHLDLKNVRQVGGKPMAAQLGKQFKRVGIHYDRHRRIVSCQGARRIEFPLQYGGADDEAGPNFTGQAAVDSYYEALSEMPHV